MSKRLFLWLLLIGYVVYDWTKGWILGRRAQLRKLPKYPLLSYPLVSILIPAWNEKSVLETTLKSLNRLTYPNWQAIVIAGGDDGTRDYAHTICKNWSRFTVISQDENGKNAALNQGFRHAIGDIIVLLDADCVVEQDWLSQLIAPLTHGYSASLANYFPVHLTPTSAQFEMEKIAAYNIRGVTILHGGGIAVHRKVIEKIGGFPEDIRTGVDWDFDQRLSRIKSTKVFVPSAHHKTYLPDSFVKYYIDEVRWRRAHFQSTLRILRDRSLEKRDGFIGLTFYIVSMFFLSAPLLNVITRYIFHSRTIYWPALWLFLLFRRVRLSIEVLAYTRNCRWIRYIWVPPLTLLLSFIASIHALLTSLRDQTHFKGSRPD